MAQNYSPKIITDGLVMCLDPSQNKSYPTTDLPVKNGLVMWMDAADDTTFSYSSGTTVSQWRDKSGSGYHMVPVSAGPTRNSFLNSRKTLTFTTSQDIQNLSIDLRTSAYTIFVVSRLTGTTNQRVLTANPGNAGSNWLLGHWGGLVNPYYAEGWVYYSPNSADTVWRIYMGDWSGTTTDLANAYSNGTSLATNSTVASGGPYSLGINAHSGERSTCEAAEIVVFNRVLSTAERRLVDTYLGQKWGISNTDRSIIDLSGNDDSGLLGGGAAANMPVYDFYNKGSLRFDGLNDTVNINNSQLNISTSITVEAWVKYNAQGGATARAYSVITYKSGWGWLLEDQSGQFNFRISTSVNGDSNVNSSYSHGLNNWNHVVGTYDGSSQKIYVDGILKNSTSLTGTINVAGNTVRLGNYEGDYNLTGNIGVVRVYNRVLSAEEVLQNYEAQKSKFANTIVQQGLVLNLDAGNPYSYAGAGTTWFDVSGNGKIGTLTGGVTYSSIYGGDFILDGVNGYVQTDLNQNTDNAQITWEAWFWDNSPGGFLDNTAIISNYGPNATTPFTILHMISDGRPYFVQRNSSATEEAVYGSTSICNSIWHHVVGVVDNSNMLIYVDGVLQQTKTKITGTTTSGQNLVIGGNHLGRYQSCRIASARCYNIALSAAQVLQNYNATKGRFGL